MKHAAAALVLLAALSGGVVCADEAATQLDPIAAPVPLPPLALRDMDGKLWQADDLRGRPVIINFWATWCEPCRAEMPAMEKAWEKLQGEDVLLLAVNFSEPEATVAAFQEDFPMSFPVLLDEQGETAGNWPLRGLPVTFVADAEGRLVYQAMGARAWDDDAILDKVRALKE
ncbi:TlpA disulfide reductase family protein [Granulosicoccaceae sp. 1_MG-2023]|nr:TlpA disulfide reductase family protein [Granulosicoccaceae sp. 1_MG-2023]